MKKFIGSEEYWEERYATGRKSGPGSYKEFADYKARFINSFIASHGIESIIDFGVGDGNQLQLFQGYKSYIGLDVSTTVIDMCHRIFNGNPSLSFKLMNEYEGEKADLSLSLEVIFHLIEDRIYERYMTRLFMSAKKFVVIYSSDHEYRQIYHIKHRKFTEWVSKNQPQFKFLGMFKNEVKGPHSNFYVYERIA